MTLFVEGDYVLFREPLAHYVETHGVVIYVLPQGLVGIRPTGCFSSRVLCPPADVRRVLCPPADVRKVERD